MIEPISATDYELPAFPEKLSWLDLFMMQRMPGVYVNMISIDIRKENYTGVVPMAVVDHEDGDIAYYAFDRDSGMFHKARHDVIKDIDEWIQGGGADDAIETLCWPYRERGSVYSRDISSTDSGRVRFLAPMAKMYDQ